MLKKGRGVVVGVRREGLCVAVCLSFSFSFSLGQELACALWRHSMSRVEEEEELATERSSERVDVVVSEKLSE